MKLNWTKCPCGHDWCIYEYPTNLGTYLQGSGFTPDEKALLDRAFAALDEKVDATDVRIAKVVEEEPKVMYLNKYRCSHKGRMAEGQPETEWEDEWDCQCNDKCPVCNAEIEPYESEEITDEDHL